MFIRERFFLPCTVIGNMRTRGFSLVELSIVLVIVGLLVGGILAGQSLIRASELRSVNADFTRYLTAVSAFRDKYFGLPGDISNATAFWGKDNTNCTADTGTTTTPGTCNGNANSRVDGVASASVTSENFQFWNQLAQAGIIEGTYSGLSGSGGGRDSVPGTNVPRGRFGGLSAIGIEWLGSVSGDTWRWNGSYGNIMYAGNKGTGSPPEIIAFKTEEAWNIDTKMDDGNPAYGKLRSYRQTGQWTNCATTNVETTAQYNLSYTTIACNLVLMTGY